MLTILLDSWFDHSIVSTTATMTKEKHVVSNNYDFARILNLFSFLKTQPNKELQEPFVCNINTRVIPMVHANIIFQGYIQSMP